MRPKKRQPFKERFIVVSIADEFPIGVTHSSQVEGPGRRLIDPSDIPRYITALIKGSEGDAGAYPQLDFQRLLGSAQVPSVEALQVKTGREKIIFRYDPADTNDSVSDAQAPNEVNRKTALTEKPIKTDTTEVADTSVTQNPEDPQATSVLPSTNIELKNKTGDQKKANKLPLTRRQRVFRNLAWISAVGAIGAGAAEVSTVVNRVIPVTVTAGIIPEDILAQLPDVAATTEAATPSPEVAATPAVEVPVIPEPREILPAIAPELNRIIDLAVLGDANTHRGFDVPPEVQRALMDAHFLIQSADNVVAVNRDEDRYGIAQYLPLDAELNDCETNGSTLVVNATTDPSVLASETVAGCVAGGNYGFNVARFDQLKMQTLTIQDVTSYLFNASRRFNVYGVDPWLQQFILQNPGASYDYTLINSEADHPAFYQALAAQLGIGAHEVPARMRDINWLPVATAVYTSWGVTGSALSTQSQVFHEVLNARYPSAGSEQVGTSVTDDIRGRSGFVQEFAAGQANFSTILANSPAATN